jgi:hypothetical protein
LASSFTYASMRAAAKYCMAALEYSPFKKLLPALIASMRACW